MAKRALPKYAAITPGLPEIPVNPDWQTRLDNFKQKALELSVDGALTPQQLLTQYKLLRQQRDELQTKLSDNYLALEAFTQMLIESNNRQEDGWGAYGASSNTLIAPNGSRIRIDVEPYATVVDKDANRQWAVKEGLERMLALPWQTLNSLVKKRLLNGQGEPPGVKTFKKRTIVLSLAGEAAAEPIEEWSPDAEMEVSSPNDPF